MIQIKSQQDIILIKQAAQIWKKVRQLLYRITKPGVTLISLNRQVAKLVNDLGGECSFYQYNGFPKHICISVNDAIIHGIPDDYIIKSNDLITFDIGITYQKHFCDAAFTIHVDPKTSEPARISQVTKDALMAAIDVIKPGAYIGDISHTIQEYATSHGYEVIRDYGGHGCGNELHEDPLILNYGKPSTGIKLVPNMTLCIEPMLLTGTNKYEIDTLNQWTVRSKNHQLTCQWEHMVLVTDTGCEILTGDT